MVVSVSSCTFGAIPAPRLASTGTSELEVKGSAPMTGYGRDKFIHWIDEDKDGCDTRSEIIERNAIPGTIIRGKDGCVTGAKVADPYSNTTITEDPGPASRIDIDHIVALGDAWKSGAAQWTQAQRQAFANDPLNLLAVDDKLNQQKGDSNAASWLPPNKSFRCEYVGKQVAVKRKYHLSVTPYERDAIAANSC